MHPAGELESWLDWDQGAFGYRWADGVPNNPLVRAVSDREERGDQGDLLRSKRKAKKGGVG